MFFSPASPPAVFAWYLTVGWVRLDVHRGTGEPKLPVDPDSVLQTVDLVSKVLILRFFMFPVLVS